MTAGMRRGRYQPAIWSFATRRRKRRVRSAPRIVDYGAGRALLDNLAVNHEYDPIGDLAGEAHLVRHHDHGHSRFREMANDREDL